MKLPEKRPPAKPRTERHVGRLPKSVHVGRNMYTHMLTCIQVAGNGRALGEPSHILLGKRLVKQTKLYRPNGEREKARRRKQIAKGHITPSRWYRDSWDTVDGGWEHREYAR